MKTIIKTLIIATIILGCTTSVSALFITDLGDVEYNDYLQVDITYPGEVNLDYVYSSINSSAMIYEKLSYIPSTNTTRYLFTSELYFPEYYERLDMEEFLFQDLNSKELYIVSIDMNDVMIPDDPYMVELIELTELYDNMSIELDETLTNLTTTWDELQDLIVLHNTTYASLNTTLARNTIIEILLSNQTHEIQTLKNDLNLSNEQLLNMTSQAGNFKRFFDEITSYKSGFYFVNNGENNWYDTIYNMDKTIQKKTSDLNNTPFIICFFIAVTVIITMMASYWKFSKNTSNPEDMEILNGTDRTTSEINRFKAALQIIPLSLKRKQAQPTTANTSEIIKPDETPLVKPEITNDNSTKIKKPISKPSLNEYNTLRNEVDDKINNLETKIDLNQQANQQNYNDIADKINMLLENNMSPATSMKK